MVLVVSPARAIDQVWQRLQDSPDTFARVAIDIALQPADAELFRRLRELSLVAGGTGFESPAAAHRLDLPTAWTGVVAQPNARSSTARVTLSSSPLGAGQGEASRRPGLVGFLGGDVSVETIFVLHVAPEGDR